MDKKGPSKRLVRGIAMASALALVALDQWTKALAAAHLAGKGVVRLAGDVVLLVFARNRGAFLSLGSGLPSPFRGLLLVVLPIAALAFLAWVILAHGLGAEGEGKARSRGAEIAVVVLIAAGGAGNLIDRLLFGEVRDFLHFRLGPLRTGIMNLADLYILAALVVIAAVALRRRSGAHRAGPSVDEAPGAGDAPPPPSDSSS
jgi:signal peptidase II